MSVRTWSSKRTSVTVTDPPAGTVLILSGMFQLSSGIPLYARPAIGLPSRMSSARCRAALAAAAVGALASASVRSRRSSVGVAGGGGGVPVSALVRPRICTTLGGVAAGTGGGVLGSWDGPAAIADPASATSPARARALPGTTLRRNLPLRRRELLWVVAVRAIEAGPFLASAIVGKKPSGKLVLPAFARGAGLGGPTPTWPTGVKEAATRGAEQRGETYRVCR